MTKDNWVEVAPSTNATTWDFKVNKEMVGIYKGQQNNIGPNNSTIYNFEVEGEAVGVWGNSVLNSRLSAVEVGSSVKIVYLGKATSPKTNRQYHNYQVFIKKQI